MFLGGFLLVLGFLLVFAPRIPFFGKIPGDIVVKREHFTLYVPLGSSFLVSVLLSVLVWLLAGRR